MNLETEVFGVEEHLATLEHRVTLVDTFDGHVQLSLGIPGNVKRQTQRLLARVK